MLTQCQSIRHNDFMQRVARTWWQRTKGLIGRRSLAPGETFLIPGCRQVHTFFMRFPIEVAFLDRDGREIAVYRLKPWRISPFIRGAVACLERAVK